MSNDPNITCGRIPVYPNVDDYDIARHDPAGDTDAYIVFDQFFGMLWLLRLSCCGFFKTREGYVYVGR